MSDIIISVVIPAYNAEKTIIDAIQSVEKQTRYDLIKEIIIVNDGSADNTEAVVEQYKQETDSKKLVLISQVNQGVSAARNAGIEKSTGDWIALLDSDDIWFPEKIEKQVNAIDQHPEISCIGTGALPGNANPGIKLTDEIYYMTTKRLFIKYWPHTPSLLIKKSILVSIGGFDTSQFYAEDGKVMVEVAAKHYIYYVVEALMDCGHGKATFGESGLSGNLLEMHRGCLKNIQFARKEGFINPLDYYLFVIFEDIKYFRRVLVVKGKKALAKKRAKQQ